MVKKSNLHQSYCFSVNLHYAQCEDLYRQQIKFLLVTNSKFECLSKICKDLFRQAACRAITG
ncbi:hypothetical protein GPUN_0801 [Glaciecola punicea ACAM 611]|uniref:Uncharacterized protein n=1 Tax=Glaciecola punicea ACAM 611 TaxID=1121923 RepID=H5T9F9_9ALTE|nr:hypothetical protein GPUN_0801 [Glaciecola punicea ACAM 611]